MTQSRILILSRHPFFADIDGAGAYLWDLLSYLAANGVRVDIATTWIPSEWNRRELLRIPRGMDEVARIHFPGVPECGRLRWMRWGSFKARSIHRARQLLPFLKAYHPKSNLPQNAGGMPKWHDPPSASDLQFFRKQIAKHDPSAVLANFCWLTPALPQNDKIPTMVLTHDVMSDKLGKQAAGDLNSPKEENPGTPQGEGSLLERADFILAISEEDAATFRSRQLPDKKVMIVPKAIRANPPPPNHQPVPGRVLFVGSDGANNIEGLHWFLQSVWPIVFKAFPEGRFHIVGDAGNALDTSLPDGVKVRGRVVDLSAEYHDAEVAVVPLLGGTGVKIKLVEAVSHHCPVVSTPAGLQGLPFLQEVVKNESEPPRFAEAVLSLLKSSVDRTTSAQNAFETAFMHLAPNRCYGKVLELVRGN